MKIDVEVDPKLEHYQSQFSGFKVRIAVSGGWRDLQSMFTWYTLARNICMDKLGPNWRFWAATPSGYTYFSFYFKTQEIANQFLLLHKLSS